MPMINDLDRATFDKKVVRVRDFVRARYHTWPTPRNGLVVSVTDDTLQALFLPAIHQSACYFRIRAEEIKAGKWQLSHISFNGDWDMVVGGEEFADEYNPDKEADADTAETSDEQPSGDSTGEISELTSNLLSEFP